MIIPNPTHKSIVAFAGKKRVGKTTAAEVLDDYELVSIADPISNIVDNTFMFPDALGKEEKFPLWGVSRREAMQMVGSELFRDAFGDLFWLKSLLFRIANSDRDKFVIDDVRFPREVKVLRSIGAHVFVVSRPEFKDDLNPIKKFLASRPLVKRVASVFLDFDSRYHRSEIEAGRLPVDLVNDGNLVQFKRMIEDAIETPLKIGENPDILPENTERASRW